MELPDEESGHGLEGDPRWRLLDSTALARPSPGPPTRTTVRPPASSRKSSGTALAATRTSPRATHGKTVDCVRPGRHDGQTGDCGNPDHGGAHLGEAGGWRER